jgi:heme A synthase
MSDDARSARAAEVREMYSAILLLHSVLRWAVIAAGLLAVVTAWRRASGGRPASSGLVFTILFDIQFLAGLALYFLLSPITRAALHDFGAAMSNDIQRFWAVEHPFGMIAALALAHIARAKLRNAGDVRQYRRAATYFTLAVAIIILTTPWPFLPYGRPLL